MIIKKGYFYYIESELSAESNKINLTQLIETGLKNNLEFIDAESYHNLRMKKKLSPEQVIQTLHRDLSETSFVICTFNNSNFSFWIDKNSKNINITFSFLDGDLTKRNYMPDNAIEVDIYSYLDLILKWLNSFDIKQFHVEYSKP